MSEKKIIRLKATVTYKGSTQTATVDITPYVVKNAYFATKKEQIIYDTSKVQTHTVTSKETIQAIAKKYNLSVDEVKNQNKLKSNKLTAGQTLSITPIKGKNITFERSCAASVGDALYVVVETKDLLGKTIEINIRQGDKKVIGDVDKELTITQNGNSQTLFKACVGELADINENLNKTYLKSLAVTEVTLAPKADKDIKTWNKSIINEKDKKTHLYILAKVDTKEKVKYNGTHDGSNYTNHFLNEEGQWLELRPVFPIITLDPGHGFSGGNVGAQSRKYKYKVKGTDGKVKLDAKKNEITEIKDVMSLPQYVINDPKKWIVGDNSSSNHKLDNKRTEFELVYLVADKMKALLQSEGYTVIMTRASASKTSVSGNKLAYRIDISNNAKSDYFISIHADGANSFVSGSHAIYSSNSFTTESKQLSEDIMKFYTVVHVESNSPKKDVRGLRVLRTTNKAKHKTLVELGFLTSPSDAKNMFNNVDKMAEQLVKGLEHNILNSFYK